MPDDRINTPAVEPGSTIGRFRVANTIADGPSGTLYEAVETATSRRVALRRLPDHLAADPAAAEQFLKSAGRGLQHPNVIAPDGIERIGGEAYLVTEFVGGRPAGGGSRMPWRMATRMIRDAGRGLAAVHNAGLIHGHVKPAHLIVTHDGGIKLADLGMVGLDDEAPVDPACAAPELIRGQPPDARTDVYELGAAYFTLLTGRPPFADAGNAIDIYDAILHRRLPTVRAGAPDVPLRCDVIVQKAMAKEPADRYASAEELLADLDAVLGADEPARVPIPKLPRRPSTWLRPTVLAVGLVVVAGFAAGGWYLYGPRRLDTQPSKKTELAARPPDVVNSIGMPLMRVSAGQFVMGDASLPDARPHLVRLRRPFLMGTTEVTQSDYEQVTAENPSHFIGDGKRPVDQVTWVEAATFCEKLSARPAEQEARRSYRLPTEAEWEYACRAGTETAFSFGPRLATEDANTAQSGFRATMPVGFYPANRFGLFDMHGNVWEWCGDWYQKDSYATGKPIDPAGPPEGTHRVARGGSWQTVPADCRSAFRGQFPPDTRSPAVGFRVVCVVEERR
jgi:formylglycine-generating enzyme required for sulfatase activity